MSAAASAGAVDAGPGFGRQALALLDADDVPALLQRALAIVVERTGAREAFVEVSTDDGGVESSHVVAEGCSPDRVNEIQALVSRGIIAEAMATGQTVETANAQLDPRFLERESVRRHEIETVLCVPIGREQPIGVVYVQGRPRGGGVAFASEAREDLELLGQVLAIAVERLTGTSTARIRRAERRPDDGFSSIICHSPALKEIVEKLRFAAPLDVHVLLTGPSGAGKTQLAHAAHAASKRRAGPFIEINCAAVPEALLENELFGAEPGAHSTVPRQGLRGKVEMATGGTLFLDEIGDLPLLAQAKILQLLQSKTYYPLGAATPRKADIRLMAATNVDLARAIQERRFREDLFYRLKVLEVRVPPLSERPEDVIPLARHFLRLALERHELAHRGLAPSAIRALQTTEWTGNVRELAHRIETAALAAEQRGADRIEQRDLLPDTPGQGDSVAEGPRSLHEATRAFQRKHIAAVLEATSWNMTEAARILDVSRAHLYTLVRSLDLSRAR